MNNHKIKNKLKTIFDTLKSANFIHDKNISKAEPIIILISAILGADERNTDSDIDFTVSCLSKELPILNASTLRNKITKKYSVQEVIKAASDLSVLKSKEKESILLSLIETSFANGSQTRKEKRILSVIAGEFSISSETLNDLYTAAFQSSVQKKKIINSAAGLILAICIIIIFLLAISYLKSVIFGLILACFCLPVQDWINRKIIKSKAFALISKLIQFMLLPLTFPIRSIKRFFYQSKGKGISSQKALDFKYISYSCTATVLSVILFLLIVLGGISWVSTYGFSTLTNSISSWVDKTSTEYEQKHLENQTDIKIQKTIEDAAEISGEKSSSIKRLTDAMLFKIESIRPTIENSELFKIIKKVLTSVVQDSDAKGGLPSFLLKRTGGIFLFTKGAIGTVISFLMDLVFMFFFFAFFLNQMAKLNYKIDNKVSPGQHIVNGISSSGWFPNLRKDTLKGTIIIIDDILTKLKSWIRGYLSIIIIETIFYVTTFLFAGVPYAVALGIVAGLTILLPYIGPVISFLLTVSVCLVFGTGGMIQVVIVLLLYLLMNGICEQLFLYPAIVGGALGLNEFETILVVLLGGILAGITGLIFAVPVAAILKYLIPKTYSVINQQRFIR